ncbi:exocyst complex component EXO70B1-like [Vigna umbellata]|uniref:exocyst complex component EXO70B1-like n=1 Tax=Vigna umbellata TaxID=87088 RepID=UPI001F5F1022|nr:exocyst complex component EXO70B1-like [Vigna umbellata]
MQTLIMLNQILRWLKRPKVLRLVCLASSVVGLLCYALSSSFKYLLGNWSWWKMLIYIVFSFIICLAVLFTPARSSSTSLRLEAHLAFLVLIITSVYSFFFDNVVKGKPDAYSLISCAAFATMSLGLSNLTQFGFQIDLLYFFCGGLTVQLMKIKLWLVTVGGGFTYSLLQLRHYPSYTQGENLQLLNQNHVIIQVDDSGRISSSSPVIMEQQANADVGSTLGTSPEDGDLIQSNSTSENGSVDDGLFVQQQFINCIKELEKENQMLVPMVCSHVEKYLKAVFDSNDKDKDQIQMLEVPVPDVNLVMDALPFEIISRLKEIVKLIVEGGFTEECSDIYSKWRKEFAEQCRRTLGLQFQTPKDEDVEKWLKTCKATSKILFPNERRLCDYLFSGFSVAADAFFDKVCKELTIGLVSFADTTMTTGNLPNLLFNIVPKMSKPLVELTRESISPILFRKLSFVNDIQGVRQRLAILNKLRELTYPNNVQAPVTDGGLHLITKKAMDHIHKIEQKFGYRFANSSFWVVIGRMIELLESELEAKSKDFYADPALSSVFMINNLSYIEQKTHDLQFDDDFQFDDDWFRTNKAKVEENYNLYLRSSWNKMVDFLKVETNELAEADVVAELMKEKLNLFNLHFEETCTIQSTWTVSDKRLKERIVKSIEEILLPEYGKFCDRFRVVFGNQAYHYIKFGFLDIQNCLSHLFLLDDEMTLEDKKTV